MKTTITSNGPVTEDTIIRQETNQSVNAKPKPDGKGEKPLWKSVLIGGVSGIALGAGGTALASDTVEHEEQPDMTGTVSQPDVVSPEVPKDICLAEGVNDDMSFGEAFAAARAEVGAGGVFEWHGQLYSTYTQGEWAAMSDGQKTEFAQGVSEVDVPQEEPASEAPGQPETPQEAPQETPATGEDVAGTDPQGDGPVSGTPSEEQGGQTPEVTADEFEHHGAIVNGEGEAVEVEVVAAGRMDVGGGESVAAVAAQVDGHDSLFVDVDNDGYVDAIVVDANDDGEVQEDEVIDMQGSDMHMTELASAEELGYNTPEEDQFAGTPDYTNDADVSTLV